MSLSPASFARDAQACKSIDPVLKLLRAESKRGILCNVASGESDVGTVTHASGLDISFVSQTLNAFYRCGLVVRRRVKHRVLYRLGPAVRSAATPGAIHFEIKAINGEQLVLDLIAFATGKHATILTAAVVMERMLAL